MLPTAEEGGVRGRVRHEERQGVGSLLWPRQGVGGVLGGEQRLEKG